MKLISSITAEDDKMATDALSPTRFIFPNADAVRIGGLAEIAVNIIASWKANDKCDDTEKEYAWQTFRFVRRFLLYVLG